MSQLLIDIGLPTDYLPENFFVSKPNLNAYTYVMNWPRWSPPHAAVIVAPPFAGKTHLGHIWAKKSKARLINLADISTDDLYSDCINHKNLWIDNADQMIDEKLLLTTYNLTRENHCFMLMTALTPPQQWNIKLPDLRSRLNSIAHFEIGFPDDHLIQAILIKRFSDLQIKTHEPVIAYLTKHIERSYIGINNIIQKINQLSLENKRNITLPFIRSIMESV